MIDEALSRNLLYATHSEEHLLRFQQKRPVKFCELNLVIYLIHSGRAALTGHVEDL